jgi:hypothetical protein
MPRVALFVALFAAGVWIAAPASAFEPFELQGLQMWLDSSDADSLDVAEDLVAQWADKGPQGNHADQSVPAFRPRLVENAHGNHTMVRFQGSDEFVGQFLRSDCIPAKAAEPRTIVMAMANVGHHPYKSNHAIHYGSAGQLEAYGIATRLGGVNRWLNHYWQSGSDSGVDSQTPGGVIVVVSYDGSVDRFFINGKASAENPVALKTAGGTYGTWGMHIGARIDPVYGKPTESGCFDVGEIIVLSTAPDKEERQKVEGYLAHKWGMVEKLPADHPYKSQKPD